MKRILSVVIVILTLCGCSSGNNAYERVITLRSKLQSCDKCAFSADITADYGDKIYAFTLDCTSDSYGNIQFVVTSPDSIAGIRGQISNSSGLLTFDEQSLAFELLADGCASPISAPWLLMRALLGGYISSCAADEKGLIIQIDDSYEEDPLTLELRTDQQLRPTHADILWQGRRIMAVEVNNFSLGDVP